MYRIDFLGFEFVHENSGELSVGVGLSSQSWDIIEVVIEKLPYESALFLAKVEKKGCESSGRLSDI